MVSRRKVAIKSLFICLTIALVACSSGGGSSTPVTNNTPTVSNFVGTQAPGDYWTWSETAISSTTASFVASNATKSLNYSGMESQLTGLSSGFSKLNITSTNDAQVITPASAYALEFPNTMIIAAVAPFYTFNHSGTVQLSIHGPVVASLQGSCPSSGTTTTANWIVMPNDTWCPTATASLATGTCTTASNAYGTSVITALSGSAVTVDVTSYHLDGSAGSPISLSSCACSNGVIQCTDTNSHPVHISFTPSGAFIQDAADYSLAGIVQPSANINMNDFFANGNSFKGMVHQPWDDYYDGCVTNSDCNVYGISNGTCLSGHCGVPETTPVTASANGTDLVATTYSDIANGILSSSTSTISFAGALQPAPGLITATIASPCGPPNFPIVLAVRQINGKYIAFIISHSTCPTFDTPMDVLAIQQ